MTRISPNLKSRLSSQKVLGFLGRSFPHSNLQILETYWLQRQASAAIESDLESMLVNSNLSSGRFLLLILLDQHPQGLRPTELAHFAGVTQATISGLLLSLEKAQLVSRENHQLDARSFVICLTTKGQELYKKLQPQFLSIVEQFYSGFDAAELNTLRNICLKISTDFETSMN